MAIIEGGVNTDKVEIETTKAMRVTQRPSQVGARGAYSFGTITGVLPAALTANSEIWQWRWTHATYLMVIRRVYVTASVSTTAFAAGVPIGLELKVARTWSAQGTGGTGITFGTDDCKKRQTFAQTAMATGDARIATTAALGAGTKTLDGFALAHVTGQPGTSVTRFIDNTMWQRDTGDEWPIVLVQNEGLVIRAVEVPATGTWKASVQIEWMEVDPSVVTGWT